MARSFDEATLEAYITELLAERGYPHTLGRDLPRTDPEAVLLRADLRSYLQRRYGPDGLTEAETERIIRELETEPASDLYASNRRILDKVMNGFTLKRDRAEDKDLYIELLDYGSVSTTPDYATPADSAQAGDVALLPGIDILAELPEPTAKTAATPTEPAAAPGANIYRFVTQLRILGNEGRERIPDGIVYINGLPLVVCEFKSAVREDATVHDAYQQITVRYRREIPQLFKYNALCIISDGPNSRMGSFFAKYEYYYTWSRIDRYVDLAGRDQLRTLIAGLLHPPRLLDVIQHFIHFPDTYPPEVKIVCRYPQYYAARALFANILAHRRPAGDGKGGTYFGATGCGKSYTMLFLSRLLMKSTELASPTLVLITDRTDLDDQLSEQFEQATDYLNDKLVKSVNSRAELRELLRDRKSGGVFLTTIQKFDEDTELLSERTNIICISDEAHRSQVNLDLQVSYSKEKGVRKRYGFAKHLRDSLPHATYVGFTGTPIDATLDVFGDVVESYTMTESVRDGITVPIVREGRAAKVVLKNEELRKIEDYYASAEAAGANEHQVEQSKKDTAKMNAILGNPERLRALAADFVAHYERRTGEGSSVLGKAMFVSSSRYIAYDFYQEVIRLRPEWAEPRNTGNADVSPSPAGRAGEGPKPMPMIAMVMTRGQDDPQALYDALGTKQDRKELERQFKRADSNFKIAIVVDMWLTGFDVPFLDTIYIDKPISRHNLIQTISRVNRKYPGKEKGLVVDYIGIKKQMNLAMAHYNQVDQRNIEEIDFSLRNLRRDLEALASLLHDFDDRGYFHGDKHEQYATLIAAAEYVQQTPTRERRLVDLVKRMKAAYDICSGSEDISREERDRIHFYLAIRSIIVKLTRGDAPDTAQMNARVQEMIQNALASDGVEELFRVDGSSDPDELFSDDYLAKIEQIKLPHTKIKLLQRLLRQAIGQLRRTNRMQGMDFSEQFRNLVERYNDRTETDILRSTIVVDMTDEFLDLYRRLREEMGSFADLGIDFEEKAFYDILKKLCVKYDFSYPEDQLLVLAQRVKELVDDQTQYVDWSNRADIRAELQANLIVLLAEHDYPPVDRDEVYQEVVAQAEGFREGRG